MRVLAPAKRIESAEMYVAVRFPDPYVMTREMYEFNWQSGRGFAMYVERQGADTRWYEGLRAEVESSVRVALDEMGVMLPPRTATFEAQEERRKLIEPYLADPVLAEMISYFDVHTA